jgi:hypothetical protein
MTPEPDRKEPPKPPRVKGKGKLLLLMIWLPSGHPPEVLPLLTSMTLC